MLFRLKSTILGLFLAFSFNLIPINRDSVSIDRKIATLEKTIKKEKKALKNLENKLKQLKRNKSAESVDVDGKVFYDLGSGTGKNVILAYLFNPDDPNVGVKFIEKNYKTISAEISDEESDKMIKEKGVPLYGEIKPKSFVKAIQYPKLNINGFKKAIGIELSPTRYNVAQKMKDKLFEEGLNIPDKTIEFRQENFLTANISDADVIHIAIYDDETIEALTKKLSNLKDGLIVTTLQSLPNGYGFEEVAELSLPMTWSDGSPVYLYKLDKSQVKK